MPDLTPLIRTVVSGLLNGHRPLMTSAVKAEWILLAFVGLCAMADVFLLTLALYQYLLAFFAPFAAALISAAVFFAVAVVAAAIRKFIIMEQASKHKSAEDKMKDDIHVMMTSLFNELEGPIRDNPKAAVAIATLAGLFAGQRL
jgi:hypothetical protein